MHKLQSLLVVPFVLSFVFAQEATVGLDTDAAAAYSAENAGLAVLVLVDRERVFETYQNGHTQDRAQHLFSGTKSFAPIAALIAEHEGLLALDEKVCDTIVEWREDPRRSKITIRQLLDFTSGLQNLDSKLHSARTRDSHEAALAAEAKHDAGRRFEYGSVHLTVFGALLERKLQAAAGDDDDAPKDFVAYLEQRVLEPIGCRVERWMRDRAGHAALPFGAFLTAREWAKFGQLLLDRGKHGDEQLVPTEHLDQCFQGSEANPHYGLNFWLYGKRLHARCAAIPEDTVAAAGMYDQRLYLVPSRRMVVVRLGRTGARSGFEDREFLERLFGGDRATGDTGGRR